MQDQGLEMEGQGLKVGSDFRSLVFKHVQIKSLVFHFKSLVLEKFSLADSSLHAGSNPLALEGFPVPLSGQV